MTVDNITKLAGRCYQIEKKLDELGEKISLQSKWIDSYIERHNSYTERLDKLEKEVNRNRQGQGAYMEILKERLDKVENEWSRFKTNTLDEETQEYIELEAKA